jgi:SOUL heme-binding protein
MDQLTPFRTSLVEDGRSQSARHTDNRKPRGRKITSFVRAGFWTSLVGIPLAAAGIAYATAPPGRSRRSRPLVAAGGAAFALALVRWQLDGRFSKEPAHERHERVGELEVRRYSPVVVAETTLAGADWDEALDSGFHRLADYISGQNAARARIELTAPAHTEEAMASGEKIAMTVPVAVTERAGGYTVTFIMPEGRTMPSLPVPLDSRIQLRELPARRVAVLRFAGAYAWERVHAKMRELLAKVEQAGWRIEGEVQFGGYDPPWTLPFLRRNEVWVELAPEPDIERPIARH